MCGKKELPEVPFQNSRKKLVGFTSKNLDIARCQSMTQADVFLYDSA